MSFIGEPEAFGKVYKKCLSQPGFEYGGVITDVDKLIHQGLPIALNSIPVNLNIMAM